MNATFTINILKKRGLLVLLCLGFFCRTTWAQVATCPAGTAPPVDFATWNWETPESAPNQAYCNTWAANVTTAQGGVQNYPMFAPWGRGAFGVPTLTKIGANGDYTKADGWELLRFDFGGRGGIRMPYFILYHKPTGLLRLFMYIVTSNPTNSVLVTMSHSDNDKVSGHSSAGIGLARKLLQAPDKYLTQAPAIEEETQNYVAFYQGSPGWAMAQFQMMFDPNTSDSRYALNAYLFVVSGVSTSDVKIDGTFQFNTAGASSAPEAKTDYSFSAPASVSKNRDANSADATALQIVTTGQKYLGNITSIGEKIADINKKAAKTVDDLGSVTREDAALWKIGMISSGIKNATQNNTLGAILGVAGQLNATLGLIGSVIGILSPETGGAGAKVSPTVSKGSITLTGTIRTQSTISTIGLLVPGTRHSSTSGGATPPNLYSQLPYYNCPLGIFTIANTPRLEKITYNRVTDRAYHQGYGNVNRYQPYNSYRVISDITPTYNPAAGVEVISVKVAIVQILPQHELALVPYPPGSAFIYHAFNYVGGQVAKGTLEAYPYEPGDASKGIEPTFSVQTPFVDISKFRSLTFNVRPPYDDQRVAIRVFATLRRLNMPADTPLIYFSQDYIPDITDAAVDTNSYQYAQYSANENSPPPFDNSTCTAIPQAYVANPVFPLEVTNTGNFTYSGGQTPLVVAGSTLFFNSSSDVQATGQVVFQAGSSVGFTGQLSIPTPTSNTSVIISTSYRASCLSPNDDYISPVSAASQQCSGYDVQANSTGNSPIVLTNSVTQKAWITLIPNPATTTTIVRLVDGNRECIQTVSLLTVQGNNVWHKQLTGDCTSEVQIPLTNVPTGLYLVRITTAVGSYISRLEVR